MLACGLAGVVVVVGFGFAAGCCPADETVTFNFIPAASWPGTVQ